MVVLATEFSQRSEGRDDKALRIGNRKDLTEDLKEKVRLIEAALYVAGRPLDLKTLCSIVGSRSQERVRKLARWLVEEYKRRNCAMEVLELDDGRYVMQLKTVYADKVKRLAIRPLLTAGPLRTLSYIAYKQPVTQKQVIEVRGKHAYSHIRELIKMGFINREKCNRDYILRTTDFFADYFGLSRNIEVMKRQLRRIFEKRGEEILPASLEDEDRREMAKIEEQVLKRREQMTATHDSGDAQNLIR
ncbi:MAG: SMC-Scp complex subunit ScpB [Candidatus Bathyarchaeia archaeon]|nr:SMC-Scp complex subunit ScpB [Candidatus Bathyarchaeota archaeon]